MKKLIILIALAAVVGVLWYWGSTRRSLLEEEGKLAKAWYGRVELPITASGEARERQRVEIKAEASGTIIEIPVSEGDVVEPDQLLLRIDEEEEARNVDKAQAAVDQAAEGLGIAELLHEQAVEDETFNVELAQEARNLAQARFEFAEFDYEWVKGLAADDHAGKIELMRKLTEYSTSKADLARTDVELRRAKDAGPRNVQRTAREIEAAKARLRSTQHNLSDTQRREVFQSSAGRRGRILNRLCYLASREERFFCGQLPEKAGPSDQAPSRIMNKAQLCPTQSNTPFAGC